MDSDLPVFQEFKSKDGKPLESLPTHIADDIVGRYVLWSDILHAFKGINVVKDWNEDRVFFVLDGYAVRLPLCIKFSDIAYYVVPSDPKVHTEERPHHIQLMKDQPSGTIAQQHATKDQEYIQDPPTNDSTLYFEHLLRSSHDFAKDLHGQIYESRSWFQKLLANAQYNYSQTLEELERLESLGVRIQADGMTKEQLSVYLHDWKQKTQLSEYQNYCSMLLDDSDIRYRFPAPRFFLLLPDDLDSWINLDPNTHTFRLYFLCGLRMSEKDPEDMPRHVHLSNHSGYTLKRSHEFLQIYGDYALRLLQMVKYGYSDTKYKIPPLETFEILSGCDAVITEGQLSKATIGSLIDKAIAYLEDLSLPMWIEEPRLSRDQSAAIKSYLDIPDGTTAEGNLQLYIGSDQNMYWICQEHVQHRLDQRMLHGLKEFIQSRRGLINMQQAILKVNLGSETEAEQFFSLVKGTKHTFHISIKLDWKATRASVKKLLDEIASTDTVTLELDGITLDAHPQGQVQYIHNLFEHVGLSRRGRHFIALLNYPRPREVCYYFDRLSIQSKSLSERPDFNWLKLLHITTVFRRWVSNAQGASDYSKAASELQSALEHDGLPEVTVVGYVEGDRHDWVSCINVIDLKEPAFIDVYSRDLDGHMLELLFGSLKRMTVHLDDLQQCKELSRVVQANALLQELNVSYYGHDVLYYFEHIVKIWLDSSTSSRLTLIDRLVDTQGRIVAQVSCRPDSTLTESSPTFDIDTVPSSRQRPATAQLSIEFLQWDCDHIFSQLGDYAASILDLATKQHPGSLNMFTLDIFRLSRYGLASVQNILLRSNLECLKVVCSPVDPSVSGSVARILGSVQWSTLKSLTLSGDHIDEWIGFWMEPHGNPLFTHKATEVGPQLLHLHLQGSGSALQVLSHTSALFVHGLVYLSPSIEVHLVNVDMEEHFFN